jgi:uncharacterized protein (DUF1501 family)
MTIQASETPGDPVNQKLTFCVSSAFGRQLRANGDRGTDHGRSLYTIIAGYGVRGGPYGRVAVNCCGRN